MLDHLSKEQWADVDRCRENALHEGLNVPIDVKALAEAAAISYAAIGQGAPEVLVASGPTAALKLAADLTGGTVKEQFSACFWSGWRVSWLTHWLHVSTIDGIEPPEQSVLEKAEAFRVLCASGPFIIPLTGVVIVHEKHTVLHRDTNGGLHCETGPAWAWADGTEVYALNGIRVPKWVVMEPSVARILSDDLPNTEQRRVAMAHYGWDRAVDELQLKVLDRSLDPTWGTLYELPESLVEDVSATLLVCENASPDRDGSVRKYGLLASGEARTVVAAQASLAQLSEAEWLGLEGAS